MGGFRTPALVQAALAHGAGVRNPSPKRTFGLRSLVLSWPPIGAAMTETRNLGEIVAIDVVGYSPDDVNE